MVPEAVGGAGRRAARLPGHAKEVARKARGLEAALVDKHTTVITALDAADGRSFAVAVAGPAALLVAKLHKIRERISEREQRRLDDKDALDVLRLLQATSTRALAGAFVPLLETARTRDVTRTRGSRKSSRRSASAPSVNLSSAWDRRAGAPRSG